MCAGLSGSTSLMAAHLAARQLDDAARITMPVGSAVPMASEVGLTSTCQALSAVWSSSWRMIPTVVTMWRSMAIRAAGASRSARAWQMSS